MAGGGNDNGCVDGVGVHARLVVVVHGDEGPVCNNTDNAEESVGSLAGDEIFDGGGVEELDVGEGEDFREEGRCEEGLGHWMISQSIARRGLRETVQRASQRQSPPHPRKGHRGQSRMHQQACA